MIQRVVQWYRTRAGARQAHDVDDILEGPLENLCGERFLQRESVDCERTGNLLRIVRQQPRRARGADSWHHVLPRWIVDARGWPQPDCG